MGIYNYVDFKMKCLICNELISYFQTKEGSGVMFLYNFTEVDNFYSICQNCGTYYEFIYSAQKKRTIKDYKMKIIKKENK